MAPPLPFQGRSAEAGDTAPGLAHRLRLFLPVRSVMRFRPVGLLLSGVLVAASACSDATAPRPLAVPGGGQSSRATVASIVPDDPFALAPAASYTVTIDPTRKNLLRFGPHTLEIPANAICTADSGYGIEEFGQGCRTERAPFTITAIVRSARDGSPRIDLSPAARFDPRKRVVLSLFFEDVSRARDTWRILYCPTATTEQCVDESLLDPSLRTHVDVKASMLFRRIRHFSGYFVEV